MLTCVELSFMENNCSEYKLSHDTGIKNIIWIDDNFSSLHSNDIERNSTTDRIIEQVQGILDVGDSAILDKIDELDSIDWTKPVSVILSEIRDTLSSTEVNLSAILNQLSDDTELSTLQLNIIKTTLQRHFELQTISLKDWLDNKDELIKSKNDTLFLIDRQFTNEGGSENEGEVIIQEILTRSNGQVDAPTCILFTQTCRDVSEEESNRSIIFNKLKNNIKNIPSYRFQVLSKSRIADSQSSGVNLINALKVLLVRRTFTKMAYGLKSRIENNLNELTEKLINSNVYELEGIIFDSTSKEGISELELLGRIYQLSQRKVLSELIVSQPDIIKEIVLLRKIKSMDKAAVSANYSYSEFIEMRSSEYWSQADSINAINSQVSNGDIFKINEKEFIFIGQPCEIFIRRDGTRKCNVGVLAPISKKSKSSMKSKASLLTSGICYSFQEHSKDDGQWLIEFNNSFHVNISALDYCSFNEDGDLKFSKISEKPSIIQIGGLGERFDLYKKIANERCDDLPVKICLDSAIKFSNSEVEGIGNELALIQDDSYNSWGSNIKRVRRLENPYAEYVMNKFFLYKSRKAFEHDFITF